MNKGLGSAVHLAHMFIGEVLTRGGSAVDATAGNGYDTLFLARRVGPSGHVYAFDVQKQALLKTHKLLEKHGLARQVTLFQAGHEEMDRLVYSPVDAVLYNLGYLPGGDHTLITRPETTIASLRAAVKLLRRGGRIGLVGYPGHPGGEAECNAVIQFAAGLDRALYNVIKISLLNRAVNAPEVILIEEGSGNNESKESTQNAGGTSE
ncbi:MAG: class I SAM-dependent methyltransferase [Desulfotomaculaceae bacterium]|nr:class I SAM-dependent methyltransferase [Desulfotomaculaceae bacterium]